MASRRKGPHFGDRWGAFASARAANVLASIAHMVIAAAIAAVVAVVSLKAIGGVNWPAYPSSNQLHALTTVGQVGCIVGLVATGWLWRRGQRALRVLARLAALVFVSAFSVVTLAMPLGATKLYLFGISVDQQFRTEYLTRLTDSAALRDMTYQGLPPFYPPGWFWIGGRIAALTGTPGWEMYKPWAIASITIAVAVALALWWQMIRFEFALIVAAATAAVTLAYSSPEPYSAMITVLLPPVLVLAWSGLRGAARSGGWAAVIGVGMFLGFAATFYTLLLVYSVFTVALMAVLLAGSRWRQGVRAAADPLLRLTVIAVIAAAIGAITWTPFLLRAAHDPVSNTGSAYHYLPADGAELSFPMLQFTLLGALCMLGTLWLVVRLRSSVRATALAIGVLAVYLWSLLSMLTTLARTTLLSFRLQPTLSVLLAAAGAFGFIELTQALARRGRDHAWGRSVIPVAAAVGLAAAIAFSQDIPDVLRPDLTIAYTDTDGHGQRGDRRPPGAEKYYPAIDAVITATTGRARDEIVVLTADYSFLSYYPYWGFQGLTSHYANPLAQFDKRAAAIKSWSKLTSAEQFVHALDNLPWPAPTVFLMRRGADDTYTLRLAEDVYPNQPNVRRYTVDFKAALFADPRFTVTNIGPFVLAIRQEPSH
ncbi:galactan 5-O-arabinofuranosyltransferase [Mycobacterium xenopi]|uniref:Galactan 5-O-arabinofuranosyltransferase n=1 Tax=Mycobacterium xenopi TaxID=1789 RepID=A0AAD1GW88_MYCXE|nr:galactan 5-O-arabinofuranosyltransferase [Mycobacterium xenopi]MDA3641220.1 galactan 5-O-arabinofuranosyltransferase [Mycobacterium xenopi]MDA3659020.1 galactan 5-O-arabinofuranosyltransferase [Mycobacterium xenopi]MDA3663133.1 galactan 5-O-arabinofuranosyltransferase [Mycobacterium xenopi]SPX79615.1 transmembrane protein [Mycobacterium xenopi]BBU20473.1 arabinofuranosyltransferase AftA [Mycobacterium xenopi]